LPKKKINGKPKKKNEINQKKKNPKPQESKKKKKRKQQTKRPISPIFSGIFFSENGQKRPFFTFFFTP
jgi:hypothetical protein